MEKSLIASGQPEAQAESVIPVLNKTERDLLVYGYLTSERGSRPFHPCGLCEWLRISRTDCAGVLRRLEALGLFQPLPDGSATLTRTGLDVAAKIRGDPSPVAVEGAR